MGDEADCMVHSKRWCLGRGWSLLWGVAGTEGLLQSMGKRGLRRGDQGCLQGQMLHIRIACSHPVTPSFPLLASWELEGEPPGGLPESWREVSLIG